jgi:hypothetical protein
LEVRGFEFRILAFSSAQHLTGDSFEHPKEASKSLRDVAIDGVYEYLDEQIDARNVIYSILLKYEQHCEWSPEKTAGDSRRRIRGDQR